MLSLRKMAVQFTQGIKWHFQESVEGIPNNTNYNISLPRRKRRKTSINTDAESALPSINKNVAPTK